MRLKSRNLWLKLPQLKNEIMKTRFLDKFVSKENRYALGIELETGRFYFSIPVFNHLVEYDEYFEISAVEYDSLIENMDKAVSFKEQCSLRREDNRMTFFPKAGNRGWAD